MNYCKNCHRPTSNPKFCSRSCSTEHKNRNSKKTKKCKNCNRETSYLKRSFCSECLDEWKGELLNKTLEDCIRPNRSDPYELIKRHAKRYYEGNHIRSSCCRCGYDKHVEVLYVVHPKNMDKQTPIYRANCLENLFALCLNCKWEYEHNLIQIPNYVFYRES